MALLWPVTSRAMSPLSTCTADGHVQRDMSAKVSWGLSPGLQPLPRVVRALKVHYTLQASEDYAGLAAEQ